MPRDALARRFGEAVGQRLDQALGELPEPLSPLGEVPSRRVRLSFAEPIADPADLARAAERLTQDLVVRLAREGMGVRRLELGFHRVDGRVEHLRIGTARPIRDPVHLARLMIGKLDTIDPGLGIEDAILAAFAVEKLAPEQLSTALSLPAGGERACPGFDPGAGMGGSPRPDIAPLLDQFAARLGPAAPARLGARESHIPERASVAVTTDSPHPNPPPLEGEGTRQKRHRPSSPSPAGGGGSGWGLAAQRTPEARAPRPIRLFAPPEPIDAVLWMVPDAPPSRFTWRRRQHRVIQADGAERIAEEWWRPDGQLVDAAGVPEAIRDYYRVEDEAGRRYWLFRAGLPGDPPPRWFVHGIFA
jgi:protein ImuB